MSLKLQYWNKKSQAFLRVISESPRSLRRDLVERSLSLWCRGAPHTYSRTIHSALNVQLRPVRPASRGVTDGVIREFAWNLLQTHRATVFLAGDALPLASAYKILGGAVTICGLSRSSLPIPHQTHYLDLFDLVNCAALDKRQWPTRPFVFHYRKVLVRYLRNNPRVRTFFDRYVNDLAATQATAIADSGMQGTFALALATLNEIVNKRPMAVYLAVAYPWMSEFLSHQPISSDARVLVSLERYERGAITK
jgi:hypothetical protein